MRALVLCGVTQEKFGPCNIAEIDVEPDSFVYSMADYYGALKFIRSLPGMDWVDSKQFGI